MFILSLSTDARSSELPANLQVVLLSKLLPFEESLSSKKNLSVYVVNSKDVFQAFKLLKAKQENSLINNLDFGNELPKKQYDIVYLDNSINLNEALIYSLKFSSLLVTSNIEQVKKGITLGLNVQNGRPMFFINKTSSDAINLNWDASVLKIATVFQ